MAMSTGPDLSRLREQRLFDAQQTILDRVMAEYQSTGED
jgi:hypothetical protein